MCDSICICDIICPLPDVDKLMDVLLLCQTNNLPDYVVYQGDEKTLLIDAILKCQAMRQPHGQAMRAAYENNDESQHHLLAMAS